MAVKRVYEKVNHPSHYGGDTPYETVKVLEAWGLAGDFFLATCVRYISRAGKKPGEPFLDDLKKAQWYLNRKVSNLETMLGDRTQTSGKSSRGTETPSKHARGFSGVKRVRISKHA